MNFSPITLLAGGGGNFGTILILYVVVIVVMFFFMSHPNTSHDKSPEASMSRPNKKAEKQKQEMFARLKIGDSVLTKAGFYGVVIDISEEVVVVEFGSDRHCRIPMQKDAILTVESAEDELRKAAAEKENGPEKEKKSWRDRRKSKADEKTAQADSLEAANESVNGSETLPGSNDGDKPFEVNRSLPGLKQEGYMMKHIKSINNGTMKESMKKGGCGECQTSCQSACKTSCTVGNQNCENPRR